MKGILTSCLDGKEKEVELEYEIKERDGEKIFWILNGVTGWESFTINGKYTNMKGIIESGWLACAGTKNKYDKLFITSSEMKKVLEKEGLI